jgi:membrane protein implicated in regulation of membrane protease activity
VTRLQPLAEKPGGTTQPVLFWLAVVAGIVTALRSRVAAGMLLLLVPLSALALGALRLVPVYERLSLWVVPALYASVAVAADGAWRAARRRVTRTPAVGLVATLALGSVGLLGADVARNSRTMLLQRRVDDAHGLDDRAGVRWLMKQRRPGDVVVTTRLALPAIWWYGGASWTPEEGLRTSSGAVVPVFEAQLTSVRPGCAERLFAQLGRPARLLVYLGFRRDGWPDAREALLLARFGEIGAITAFRPFAEIGGAMVIDAEQPPGPWPQLPPRPWAGGKTTTPAAQNCVAVRAAQPW